jgi:NAD(P)-dependent dehydrogenase (short-subunit alcohol dehydrogenase family)
VTGANRGLGLEIARQLGHLGHDVVIGARDIGKGRTAVSMLETEGLVALAVELDVDSPGSVRSAITELTGLKGPIGILVNNAGVLLDGPDAQTASVLDMPCERLAAAFRTNAIGPLLTMQAVIPGMRKRGYGRIVNISSRAGQLDELRAGIPSYRVSKTALNSLTRVIAAEFADDNIKINAMCPGWIRTDMGGPNAPISVEDGAATAIWLATLPDDGPTGGFFRELKALPW